MADVSFSVGSYTTGKSTNLFDEKVFKDFETIKIEQSEDSSLLDEARRIAVKVLEKSGENDFQLAIKKGDMKSIMPVIYKKDIVAYTNKKRGIEAADVLAGYIVTDIGK